MLGFIGFTQENMFKASFEVPANNVKWVTRELVLVKSINTLPHISANFLRLLALCSGTFLGNDLPTTTKDSSVLLQTTEIRSIPHK